MNDAARAALAELSVLGDAAEAVILKIASATRDIELAAQRVSMGEPPPGAALPAAPAVPALPQGTEDSLGKGDLPIASPQLVALIDGMLGLSFGAPESRVAWDERLEKLRDGARTTRENVDAAQGLKDAVDVTCKALQYYERRDWKQEREADKDAGSVATAALAKVRRLGLI